MAATFPLPQAGYHLGELVDRARRGHDRVVLTDRGEPAAVLISVDELAELDEFRRTQDEADIALCETIKSRNETGLSHDDFMAVLAAEDADTGAQ
jgi:prevent-host-death family protein